MIRKAYLLALPFALAACGAEPDAPQAEATPQASQSPTTNPLVERFDDTVIVVDSNGVGAKGATPFRFSAARSEVDAALTQAFGSDPERGENAECGAGPMQFSTYGPLKVAYQGDKLAGWFLSPGGGVTTSDGIRPGTTTMTGLKEERQVREIESTFPGEFEYTSADYGTVRGFSDGEEITGLQAGLSCFFR